MVLQNINQSLVNMQVASAMRLRLRYAIPATSYAPATPCPVLTQRMVLPVRRARARAPYCGEDPGQSPTSMILRVASCSCAYWHSIVRQTHGAMNTRVWRYEPGTNTWVWSYQGEINAGASNKPFDEVHCPHTLCSCDFPPTRAKSGEIEQSSAKSGGGKLRKWGNR